MSSPSIAMWLEDSELMLEPSPMSTGICPMSVFDKFGWDSDILGPDTDELLDKICIKTEPEDETLDEKTNTDFGSLDSIFPDILDETKGAVDFDDPIKPLLSPSSMTSLYEEAIHSPLYEQAVIVKDETVDPEPEPEPEPETEPVVSDTVPVMMVQSQPTNTVPSPVANSIIRIPVKRSGGFGIGRALKAVVVCPDRSKSIVCNVVRSTNKGIVIQKPVSRSLLNVCARNESTKLPIKVNVISSKENCLSLGAIRQTIPTTATNAVRVEPILTTSSTMKMTATPIVPEVKVESTSPASMKVEFEEVRPETPQSLISSDEEFHPFSSPGKNSTVVGCLDSIKEDFIKACLLEEDNLSSESYKCMPPAEVTGQVQAVIPDIFKYTPNSSPTSSSAYGDTTSDLLLKMDSNTSSPQSPNTLNQFYKKAVANVDHDYGFTCRNTKSTGIFTTDSLGIQTPSASEPPTDSDDDETLLNDVSLLNKDFDCSELDREQQEYFENLKHQLKLAELMCKNRDKEHKSKSVGGSLKDRKMAARNRKRKHSKDRSSENRMNALKATTAANSTASSVIDSCSRFTTTTTVPTATTTGTLKVRLPVKDASSRSGSNSSSVNGLTPKRKKTGSGGRVFSPSERHLHNTNEQVRRIEMRQSFEELRRLVPNLVDKPRAPKVCILQEAKMYCDELFHNDLKLQAQVTALKCQQERLRCAVSQLRRCAAASRH